MRCAHDIAYRTVLFVPLVTKVPNTQGGHRRHVECMKCGETLPLGPSNDADYRVEIEIKAAELATAWKDDGGIADVSTADERTGWSGWPYRQPMNERELTGFLACQIHHHEQDLGDVNWAGRHMADYDVDDLTYSRRANGGVE